MADRLKDNDKDKLIDKNISLQLRYSHTSQLSSSTDWKNLALTQSLSCHKVAKYKKIIKYTRTGMIGAVKSISDG